MDIIRTNQVAITAAATAIISKYEVPEYQEGMNISVKNTGGEPVYIGREDVTTDCGYPLAENESLEIKSFIYSDSLYGICDTSESSTIAWLATTIHESYK